jgi:hypothetical protein
MMQPLDWTRELLIALTLAFSDISESKVHATWLNEAHLGHANLL